MSSISTSKTTKTKTLQFSINSKHRKSLRLGNITLRQARQVQAYVDDLVLCSKTGTSPKDGNAQWLSDISDDLYERLVKAGLCQPKADQNEATLEDLCERFIKSKEGSVKPSTLLTYHRAVNHLYAYFTESKSVNAITPADALDFQSYLRSKNAADRDEPLSDATCRKCCSLARQFFTYGKEAGWLEQNPFAHRGIKVVVCGNEEKRRYIDHELITQLPDHAPSQQWCLLLVLGRYGGLCIPSEIKGMKWGHVNWQDSKLTILSPQTAGCDRDRRVIPLFPEIRAELEQVYTQAGEGSLNIFDEDIRKHTNLCTPLRRLGLKASVSNIEGLTWKNMRASAATDALSEYGPAIESAWIGHGQATAIEHYSIVRDSDYQEAINRTSRLTQKAPCSSLQNPVQNLPHLNRIKRKRKMKNSPLFR